MAIDKSRASTSPQAAEPQWAGRREILSWACYDVANASYATVVATAVYNPYFVKEIVGGAIPLPEAGGLGTMMLAVGIATASALIVLTAPLLGTIADVTAGKRRMLFASTLGCIIATALLSTVTSGQWGLALLLLVIANFCFGTGENFIASFLPELAPKEKMGRLSALGWGAGYGGGLISLGSATTYVWWARAHKIPDTVYVPHIVLGCALLFAVLCVPTLLWLRERAQPDRTGEQRNYLTQTWTRLKTTFTHSLYYRDLFNILIAIFVYSCGTATITHLASVYAQHTLKFTAEDLLVMILVVDATAVIGAFVFGALQDRIGSVRTLTITLFIWTVAVLLAAAAQTKMALWVAANIVGIAMGASGSAGRALVGRFSPPGRSGEFLGLWGLSMKAATCVGVLVFGGVSYVTRGDLRLSMLCLLPFFLGGILLVLRVNEERGMAAAEHEVTDT